MIKKVIKYSFVSLAIAVVTSAIAQTTPDSGIYYGGNGYGRNPVSGVTTTPGLYDVNGSLLTSTVAITGSTYTLEYNDRVVNTNYVQFYPWYTAGWKYTLKLTFSNSIWKQFTQAVVGFQVASWVGTTNSAGITTLSSVSYFFNYPPTAPVRVTGNPMKPWSVVNNYRSVYPVNLYLNNPSSGYASFSPDTTDSTGKTAVYTFYCNDMSPYSWPKLIGQTLQPSGAGMGPDSSQLIVDPTGAPQSNWAGVCWLFAQVPVDVSHDTFGTCSLTNLWNVYPTSIAGGGN